MPIYEYRCNKCGKTFEVLQKISDPPVSSCRFCESEDVSKLLSLTAFSLKGGGWYMTDYNKKDNAGKKSEKSPPVTADKDSKDKRADNKEAKPSDKPTTAA